MTHVTRVRGDRSAVQVSQGAPAAQRVAPRTVPADDLDEATLVVRAQEGDARAFELLAQGHQDALYRLAVRVMGDRAEAEDALQEALISALRSVERFERRSAVRTWLYRIVVNASLDRLRRNAARPSSSIEGHDPADPADDAARLADRMDVMAALQQLSPGQRAAVVLVHVEGMSVAEAAEVLDLPEGTVKSRCSRGRAQLAQILHPGNPDGPGDVEDTDGTTPGTGTNRRAGEPA